MTTEKNVPPARTLEPLHTYQDPAHAEFSALIRALECGMFEAYTQRSLAGYRAYEVTLEVFIGNAVIGSPMYETAQLMRASTVAFAQSDGQIESHGRAVKKLVEEMSVQGELADLIRHAGMMLEAYSASPEQQQEPLEVKVSPAPIVPGVMQHLRNFRADQQAVRDSRLRGQKPRLRLISDDEDPSP